MSFRLYESAWVSVAGVDQPIQVHKDPANPAAFDVGGYKYDIDARPLVNNADTPKITALLSIQAVREAGLRSHYGDEADSGPRKAR